VCAVSEPYTRVVPIWNQYVVSLRLASTLPCSVTVENVRLDTPPVVTSGLAASAAAGASSASASAVIKARLNMNPPVVNCPYPRPVNTARARMVRSARETAPAAHRARRRCTTCRHASASDPSFAPRAR
jgi:hypothetical protein